ncbi:MAG: hypothetical protein IT238_11375 [Bacteroidia bacterium]|nr:hypothetical protein [Bacteroidia bacterium]MCZ2249457.1 hypothetical protein [Bacteroidia bacterium]
MNYSYIKYCWLLLLLLLGLAVNAEGDWTFSLGVAVRDSESKMQLNEANILITDKNTGAKVYSAFSSSDQKIKFNLEKNRDYILKISGSNYVSKTITISTRNVPDPEKNIPNYIFDVSAEIFTEIPGEDYSAFRQAFGMIMFDEVKKDFVWMPNPEAKQKEDELKEKRKAERKKQETKKSAVETGISELDKLEQRRIKAAERSKELEIKRLEEENFRKAMREEALANFNPNYFEPKMRYVQSISEDSIEGQNHVIYIKKVVFENSDIVIYRKIVFDWGGIYYKQNEYDISEMTYDLIMKTIVLKQ